MPQPIDLYYWTTPNGYKISIALEELGLPYDIHWINIGKGDQFEPSFLEISPNNRIPAIVDPDGPDGQPVAIFESGAILQYLARKTGQLYGETERDRIAVDQWLMWQMGGLGPMAGQAHHFLSYAPDRDPPVVLPYAQDRYRNECKRLYSVLNKQLQGREFVAGDFYSIADIAIWSWADRHERHQVDFADYPEVQRWHAALWERPAVKVGRTLKCDDSEKALSRAESRQRDELLFNQTGDAPKAG